MGKGSKENKNKIVLFVLHYASLVYSVYRTATERTGNNNEKKHRQSKFLFSRDDIFSVIATACRFGDVTSFTKEWLFSDSRN